jgi:8-oxo-dGTP pyrophosphatase MutT (NUDIX family)
MICQVSDSVIEHINREIAQCHSNKDYRPVAVGIVENDQGCFLIIQSAKEATFWGFPQGGIDAEEDVVFGLVRELGEEVGILPEDVTVINYCGVNQLDIHRDEGRGFTKGKRYYYFHLLWNGSQPLKLDLAKVAVYKWVSPDELEQSLATVREEKRRALLDAFAQIKRH